MKFRKITQLLKIKIIYKNKFPLPAFFGQCNRKHRSFFRPCRPSLEKSCVPKTSIDSIHCIALKLTCNSDIQKLVHKTENINNLKNKSPVPSFFVGMQPNISTEVF